MGLGVHACLHCVGVKYQICSYNKLKNFLRP